MKSTGKVVSDV